MQPDSIPQSQQAPELDYYCHYQRKLLLNLIPLAKGNSSGLGSGFAMAAARNETWRYRHHRLYQTLAMPR